MIKNILLLFITVILVTHYSSGQSKNFALQQGDILFQDLDCGLFCDAIEKVTQGYKGAKFSHVAIAVLDKEGNIFVIEAVSKGVSILSLNDFLAKTYDSLHQPKVMVGRLKPEYQYLIPKAIEEAYKLVGQPYDDVFCITNNNYYCSELIYEIFKKANNNHAFFTLHPMTFKDPETGKTFPAWVDYFKDLNQPIPEGELGNAPGDLSLSEKIKIVHLYGIPNGYKGKKLIK